MTRKIVIAWWFLMAGLGPTKTPTMVGPFDAYGECKQAERIVENRKDGLAWGVFYVLISCWEARGR